MIHQNDEAVFFNNVQGKEKTSSKSIGIGPIHLCRSIVLYLLFFGNADSMIQISRGYSPSLLSQQ